MAKESIFGGLLIALGLAATGVVAYFLSGKKFEDLKIPSLDDFLKLPVLSDPIPPKGDGGGGGGTSGGGSSGGGSTDSGGSCSLAFAGDFGSGRNSNWKKTTKLAKDAKVNYFVGCGDYSYTNTGDFKPVVDDLKKGGVKFKGNEGNHDSSSYAKLFDNQPSMLYAWDCGPAHIVLLNTESSASANASFLEKSLKGTKKAWKIIAFHKCLYTNSSDHGEEGSLRSAIDPIIKKYGVALVVYAHNHNYQRFQFSHKTMYVCAGTGGESHYSLKGKKSGTKYTNASDFGILKVTINGSTLKGEFIAHGGAKKDSFSLAAADFKKANLAYAMDAMIARVPSF